MPVKKSNPDERPLTRTRGWTKVIHDPIPELGRRLQRYYRKDDPKTGDYFVSLYLPEDGTVVSTEKVSGSDTGESHIFDGDYKFATEMASINPRRRRATAPEGLARHLPPTLWPCIHADWAQGMTLEVRKNLDSEEPATLGDASSLGLTSEDLSALRQRADEDDAAAAAVAGRVADRVAAAEEAVEAETRRRAQVAIDKLSGGGYKNKKRTKKRKKKSKKRQSTKRQSKKRQSKKRKSRKRLKTRKRR